MFIAVLKVVGWIVVCSPHGLVLLSLPFWMLRSCRRGLIMRSGRSFRLSLEGALLCIARDKQQWAVPLERVVRARLAVNGNWTESTLVEDALTLFDDHARPLSKFPTSALGFERVLRALTDRGIPIERVEVEAPAYLD